MTKAGFVGLGSMGAPLARHIAAAGFDLAVFDPFPAALAAFEGTARTASSAADAATDAEIVGICVRDETQIRDVLFGEGGMTAVLAPGTMVLIHSTISVAAITEIAARLAESGVVAIDAPVSRTRRTEDGPFVFTMMGGDEAAIDRVSPLVQAFSTEIERMGPLGAGMATKIANNMVTWVQMIVGVQATALAMSNGVGMDQLLTVMRSNGNLTPTMASIIGSKFHPDLPADRRELLSSQGGIGAKDLSLALQGLEAAGLDDRMVREAQSMIDHMMKHPPLAKLGN